MNEKVSPHRPAPVSRYRYRILALLFAATTINYMDRSILGVLAPTLQYKVFHWSDRDYALINISFKAAYAIGLVSMGAVVDRIGTRLGYALAIAIWSAFGMMHALVRPAFGLIGFCIARFGLGLGESGNFPAAIKTTAEWFPKRERALATGVFNAGANVGAILAPLIIPLVVKTDGRNWQFAFLTTGLLSLTWVIVWLRNYRQPGSHPCVSQEELDYIHSDAPPGVVARIPWSRVLPLRETWAFSLGKITDAVWWFYLFWGGKFLYDRFGLDIKQVALPLIVIYVVSDCGSVAGGWMSSALIRHGWSVNRSRKTTLLVCALSVMPVFFVTRIDTRFATDPAFFEHLSSSPATRIPESDIQAMKSLSDRSYGSAKEFVEAISSVLPRADEVRFESALLDFARSDRLYWVAVLLIGLAAAGHQAWSANLYTLVTDVFPRGATASVIGFGGMFGALAGLVSDWGLGSVLTHSGPSGYMFAFMVAGSAYLFFLGVIQLLMPTMKPLDENLMRAGKAL